MQAQVEKIKIIQDKENDIRNMIGDSLNEQVDYAYSVWQNLSGEYEFNGYTMEWACKALPEAPEDGYLYFETFDVWVNGPDDSVDFAIHTLNNHDLLDLEELMDEIKEYVRDFIKENI